MSEPRATVRLREMFRRWNNGPEMLRLLDEALAEAASPDSEALRALADLTDEMLVDIIEQAIFETDTGLAAALLASERIRAALTPEAK
jgi:hypothetical protein